MKLRTTFAVLLLVGTVTLGLVAYGGSKPTTTSRSRAIGRWRRGRPGSRTGGGTRGNVPEHGGDTPTVAVTVGERDGPIPVAIRVSDDGPDIPEYSGR